MLSDQAVTRAIPVSFCSAFLFLKLYDFTLESSFSWLRRGHRVILCLLGFALAGMITASKSHSHLRHNLVDAIIGEPATSYSLIRLNFNGHRQRLLRKFSVLLLSSKHFAFGPTIRLHSTQHRWRTHHPFMHVNPWVWYVELWKAFEAKNNFFILRYKFFLAFFQESFYASNEMGFGLPQSLFLLIMKYTCEISFFILRSWLWDDQLFRAEKSGAKSAVRNNFFFDIIIRHLSTHSFL